MSIIERWIRIRFFVGCFFVGFFGWSAQVCAASPSLLISEVAVGMGSSRNEFVEIFNFGNQNINLRSAGIQLKLISSTGAVTNKNLTWNHETIPAGGYFLLGAGSHGVALDATYGGTLLTEKGGVLLTDQQGSILDQVSWISMVTDTSLQRQAGNMTANDPTAFLVSESPDPRNSTGSGSDLEDEEGPEEVICAGSPEQVRFNEIFPYPDTGEEEYVELKNSTEECVNISGWKIVDAGNHVFLIPQGTVIEAGELWYLSRDFQLNNTSQETISLLDTADVLKDEVVYDRAIRHSSWSFDGERWEWTSVLTPGNENQFNEEEEGDIVTGDGTVYEIRLNEIMAHPKKNESTDEYIELYNGEEKAIQLEGWRLKDASSKKFIFPVGSVIQPGEYLVVYRSTFSFALNNTGRESVFLMDPQGHTVSEMDYEGAKSGISHSLDDRIWRLSRIPTPGQANAFGSSPKLSVEKVKTGYTGVPVEFSASVKQSKKTKKKSKNEPRFTWDFGDKHKSTLQNPSHTFARSGTYTVRLRVESGAEEATKSFKIRIKKYPKVAADITSILPNPVGNDTGQEWIEIKNNATKTIHLKGWKIATGQQDLVNHVITGDIAVLAGKTARITREDAAFFLNNKSSTLELRYPNGKTAARLVYTREKSVDGEVCYNRSGMCSWVAPADEDEVAQGEERQTEEAVGWIGPPSSSLVPDMSPAIPLAPGDATQSEHAAQSASLTLALEGQGGEANEGSVVRSASALSVPGENTTIWVENLGIVMNIFLKSLW